MWGWGKVECVFGHGEFLRCWSDGAALMSEHTLHFYTHPIYTKNFYHQASYRPTNPLQSRLPHYFPRTAVLQVQFPFRNTHIIYAFATLTIHSTVSSGLLKNGL